MLLKLRLRSEKLAARIIHLGANRPPMRITAYHPEK